MRPAILASSVSAPCANAASTAATSAAGPYRAMSVLGVPSNVSAQPIFLKSIALKLIELRNNKTTSELRDVGNGTDGKLMSVLAQI